MVQEAGFWGFTQRLSIRPWSFLSGTEKRVAEVLGYYLVNTDLVMCLVQLILVVT